MSLKKEIIVVEYYGRIDIDRVVNYLERRGESSAICDFEILDQNNHRELKEFILSMLGLRKWASLEEVNGKIKEIFEMA